MLETNGIHASYVRVPILRGVTMNVEAGETVALLGRNGTGKTTLLRVIMGLVPASEGSVRLNGMDVTKLAPQLRSEMGLAYVPQGRLVFPRLSVIDNIRVAARGHRREQRLMVSRLFDQFPVLSERRNQSAGTLSGGEQQMLTIARALATEPQVILLDEPTEGIQPTIVSTLTDLIDRIGSEMGLAVLLVEQRLEVAAKLASRGYVLNKGAIARTIDVNEMVVDKNLQREMLGV